MDLPEHARKLLGAYEGLRGYHILPEGEAAREDARPTGLASPIGGASVLASRANKVQEISQLAGLTHAAALSRKVPIAAGGT